MLYRVISMAGLAVMLAVINVGGADASQLKTWTADKIVSLKGTVLKKQVNFPVKVSNGQRFKMAGFFYFKVKSVKGCVHHKDRKLAFACLMRKNVVRQPLHTVIHGLTYNHRYWDSDDINKRSYSYARFMARKGFLVLGLDLLGSGKSDVPDGDLMNISESSFTIAQVLFGLKSGKNPLNRSFKKVILVGHSLGGILSVATLGTFPHAADALIVTAWAFAPHVVLPPEIVEAAFRNPYVQLPPNIRENLFYFLPKADPAVIAFDNRILADQSPRGIFTEGLAILEAMARGNADDVAFIKEASGSARIRVPVLIQLGEFDVIAPARLAGQEADFYPNARNVKVQTIAKIGHSFNLHLKNQKSWKRIVQWLDRILR